MTGRRRAGVLVTIALVVAACSPAEPTPGAAVVGSSGAPGELTIVARNILFDPPALSVPAGIPLTITFDNQEAGIPHNLRLLGDAQFSTTLVESEIVAGPATLQLAVPGLVPGRYRFGCSVHPHMGVDLTVGG